MGVDFLFSLFVNGRSGGDYLDPQTAYMDFQTAKGTEKEAKLGVAAKAMAADIKAAFETGLLNEVGRRS